MSDIEPFRHDLATPYPSQERERYSLSESTTSKVAALEDLCKIQPPSLKSTLAQAQVIALSVAASSTIEGEGLPDELVKKIVTPDPYEKEADRLSKLWAITEAGEHVTDDLRRRIECHQDIMLAYEQLLHSRSFDVISPEVITETHKKMFDRTSPSIAGSFKNKEVEIRWYKPDGNLEKVPTVPSQLVPEHVLALSELTNLRLSEKPLGNILIAAEFCCDFLAIHPFLDGNGRLSRMLCGYILKRTGYYLIEAYPLEQIILETRPSYYKCLNQAQRFWRRESEDLTSWVDYFIECLTEHSRRAKRAVSLQLE